MLPKSPWSAGLFHGSQVSELSFLTCSNTQEGHILVDFLCYTAFYILPITLPPEPKEERKEEKGSDET